MAATGGGLLSPRGAGHRPRSHRTPCPPRPAQLSPASLQPPQPQPQAEKHQKYNDPFFFSTSRLPASGLLRRGRIQTQFNFPVQVIPAASNKKIKSRGEGVWGPVLFLLTGFRKGGAWGVGAGLLRVWCGFGGARSGPLVSPLAFISRPLCRLPTSRLQHRRWEQVEICIPPTPVEFAGEIPRRRRAPDVPQHRVPPTQPDAGGQDPLPATTPNGARQPPPQPWRPRQLRLPPPPKPGFYF